MLTKTAQKVNVKEYILTNLCVDKYGSYLLLTLLWLDLTARWLEKAVHACSLDTLFYANSMTGSDTREN